MCSYIRVASGVEDTCHTAGELAPPSFLTSFASLHRLLFVALDLMYSVPLYLCSWLMMLQDNVVSLSQEKSTWFGQCNDIENKSSVITSMIWEYLTALGRKIVHCCKEGSI